jgi:hypothetical protein
MQGVAEDTFAAARVRQPVKVRIRPATGNKTSAKRSFTFIFIKGNRVDLNQNGATGQLLFVTGGEYGACGRHAEWYGMIL